MKRGFPFVKQTVQGFSQDKAGQLSAAFAYVAIFSIGPLLLVLISVAGLAFGEQAVKGDLFAQLSGAIGPEAAKSIQDVVANTYQSGSRGLALAAGIVGMLIGAAGLTTQLQNSFNIIFSVVPDPKSGLKRTIYVKLKNILLVVLGGLAVVASLVVSAIVAGLGSKIQSELGVPAVVIELINNSISLMIFVGILYFIYRILPDVRLPRKVVLIAALGVSLLFLIGKIILGIVIGNNGTASAYGAAASLVTLLLWVYYSGQILFIGAEGIKTYATNNSVVFAPKKYNLRRLTINLDAGNLGSRVAESFIRGFKNNGQKK